MKRIGQNSFPFCSAVLLFHHGHSLPAPGPAIILTALMFQQLPWAVEPCGLN